MPCPNAPQAFVHHPRTTPLQMFCLRFVSLDKWQDPAKFFHRARHVEDPALVRGAVPLLQRTQSRFAVQ
jgi:hypothetical protein